jgi:hypothetical protein
MTALVFFRYIFIYIITILAHALSAQNTELPPHGISPLFTFGHTILTKKQFAFSQEVLYGKTKPFPTLLSLTQFFYGITDILTISGNIPAIHEKTYSNVKESGLGDCYINFHTLIYDNKIDSYDYRIINLTGVHFPTTTGAFGQSIYTYNTTSFFLGITYDALTHDWFFYNDIGALLFLKNGKTQYGHFFNINCGMARNFQLNKNFLSLFIEMSDFYTLPNKVRNVVDLTSGGNILLLGPTIRFAHENGFLIQAGIQFNISENLRNPLSTTGYLAGGFIAYSF